MSINMTPNRTISGRSHRCEWWYEAEDSEFPSRFAFHLVYQIRDGQVVLKAIEPQCVVTSDFRGNRMFSHEFNELERGDIKRWFTNRLRSLGEALVESMTARITHDRQSRADSTVETFRELEQEQIFNGKSDPICHSWRTEES